MANVNPGPAVNGIPSSVAGYVPVNSGTNANPVLTSALRLIATFRGFNCAAVGDYPMPVFDTQRFAPSSVWYAVNSSTTVAASAAFLSAASIGIYPATGGTGTAIVTAAAGVTLGASLTSITTGTVIGTTAVTAQTLYLRVGTAASTAAYFDVFLYGHDLT
jgi:hypothetical protein